MNAQHDAAYYTSEGAGGLAMSREGTGKSLYLMQINGNDVFILSATLTQNWQSHYSTLSMQSISYAGPVPSPGPLSAEGFSTNGFIYIAAINRSVHSGMWLNGVMHNHMPLLQNSTLT